MAIVALQPNKTLPAYAPGQYVMLTIGKTEFPFSIAAFHKDQLELHVQVLSLQSPLHAFLSATGQPWNISMPFGSAFLHEEVKQPTILLAGGSGIAPIRAILQQMLALNWPETIHLYWGVRHSRLLYLHEELLSLAEQHSQLKYIPVVSDVDTHWQGRKGLIHQSVLEDFGDMAPFCAYMAGPFVMSEKAREAFGDKGMLTNAMFSDAFNLSQDEAS